MTVHIDSADRGELLNQFERIAETDSWSVDDVPAEWLAPVSCSITGRAAATGCSAKRHCCVRAGAGCSTADVLF